MPILPHLVAISIAPFILSQEGKTSLFSHFLAGNIFQMDNDADVC